MATTHTYCNALKYDDSKLPSELQLIGSAALVLVLRAGFDFASNLTRGKHQAAIEVTHQALYNLVTDKRWDPSKSPLRDHFLALIKSSARELRYLSHEERAACGFFAHDRGKSTRSPEDLLIELEEQGELDMRDAGRAALAGAVRERLASHAVASAIIAAWEADGDVPPRKLAERLNVSVRTVYSAIELIRYHAGQCRKALRRKGEAS